MRSHSLSNDSSEGVPDPALADSDSDSDSDDDDKGGPYCNCKNKEEL